MKATAAAIPFAGSVLTEYRHVCAFFSSPQEEYATILLPWRTELTFDINLCQQQGPGLYKCPAIDKAICNPDSMEPRLSVCVLAKY